MADELMLEELPPFPAFSAPRSVPPSALPSSPLIDTREFMILFAWVAFKDRLKLTRESQLLSATTETTTGRQKTAPPALAATLSEHDRALMDQTRREDQSKRDKKKAEDSKRAKAKPEGKGGRPPKKNDTPKPQDPASSGKP